MLLGTFMIGILVGAILGAFVICCCVAGKDVDEIDKAYADILATYDKEVNRQSKIISNAKKYIIENYSNDDGEIWHEDIEKIFNLLEGKKDLLNTLKEDDKE